MSIFSGGTDALVQLLARRKVEQQQAMVNALQVADKQKQWHSEQERIRQNDEQLKQTAENQRQLRLEADRRQAEVERLHEQQLAQNIRENALPEENMDPKAAELLRKYYLDNGIVQRTPGMSMDMQRTEQAPTAPGEIPLLPQANRGVLKVTPDKIKSLGGTRWQAARQAEQEKKDAAKEAERAADERLKDTLESRERQAQQHNETMALIKGMSAQAQPDYEEMAELVKQNPAALDMMTPTVKTKVIAKLGPDFDYRKPMSEGATEKIANINSTMGIVKRALTLLDDPKTQAEMGPVRGRVMQYVKGSPAQVLAGKFALIKQVVGKQMEGGVLRKEDETKYDQILLNISNDPVVAKSQMNEVLSMLENTQKYHRAMEDSQGRRGNPRAPRASGAGGAALSDEEVKRQAAEILAAGKK